MMLSTVQLLAIPVPPPNASCVESPIHWAHSPSPRDSTFHGILLSTLIAVTPATIIRFKKFIRSMPNQFHPALAPNLSGYSVSCQVGIASYLQSQVLDAAWQAVLGMVSRERDYDLRSTKLFGIDDTPDQMFVGNFVNEDGSTRSEEFVIVVFKSPGYIRGLLPVIDMRDQTGYKDTENWVALTQQLRTYAQNSMAKDIIVMDEAAAIYFRFVDSPGDVYDNVEFLIVDSTCEGATASSPFSTRELVAFVCWRALVKKGVKFPDGVNGYNRETVVNRYPSILEPRASPELWRQTIDSPREMLHQNSIREQTGKQSGSIIRFAGWTVGHAFELGLVSPFDHHADEELFGLPQLDVQVPFASLGSSCDSLKSSSYHDSNRRTRDFSQPPSGCGTYIVENLFADRVAEVSSPQLPGRWVAKFFGTDAESMENLASEVRIYNLCKQCQGREIPYAYGIGVMDSGRVLLMEAISPGITIARIRGAAREGDEEAASRLQKLMISAKVAVESLHRYGVVHNDLYGENLLVCKSEGGGDEAVVIADFDVAIVFDGGSGRKQREDQATLRAAFEFESGDGGASLAISCLKE